MKMINLSSLSNEVVVVSGARSAPSPKNKKKKGPAKKGPKRKPASKKKPAKRKGIKAPAKRKKTRQ